MANKVVLSNRFNQKLAMIYAYIENNFSAGLAKELVEKIDLKILIASHHPGIGVASSKMPGVYKISVSRYYKIYYRLKGNQVVMLDLLGTTIRNQDGTF